MASREARLYEVLGKTRDDGKEYKTSLCLICGGYVVYLPDAQCSKCGHLTPAKIISVPEGFISEARSAIREAQELTATHVAWV